MSLAFDLQSIDNLKQSYDKNVYALSVVNDKISSLKFELQQLETNTLVEYRNQLKQANDSCLSLELVENDLEIECSVLHTSLEQCRNVVKQLEFERQRLAVEEQSTRDRVAKLNESFTQLITHDFTAERLQSLNRELNSAQQLLEQQSSKLKAVANDLSSKKAQRDTEKSQIEIECLAAEQELNQYVAKLNDVRSTLRKHEQELQSESVLKQLLQTRDKLERQYDETASRLQRLLTQSDNADNDEII